MPSDGDTTAPGTSPPPTRPPRLPSGIWALGLVSLLMDTSSELVHSLLPLFLVMGLGTGALAVGIIDGIAEATANLTKLFSGRLSDWLGKRKALALAGYGLAALSKPLFPLAATPAMVLGARFLDRIGKGVRGAPRDALIADITSPDQRGAAYGLRQSLDTVGAILGPLLAMALMAATADNFRLVFWAATVPAFLAVLVLALAVKEPPHIATGPKPTGFRLRRGELVALGPAYWALLAIAFAQALGRVSEAFLLLRAQGTGLALEWVPGVLIAMNLVYTASAYPAGRLSDRLGRHGLLAAGSALLVLTLLVLAAANGIWLVLLAAAIWGLQMGLTQGLFASLVADSAPPNLRGTAFGLFNLATGLAMIPGNLLAGFLWDRVGAPAALLTAAGFAALALAGLLVWRRKNGAGTTGNRAGA